MLKKGAGRENGMLAKDLPKDKETVEGDTKLYTEKNGVATNWCRFGH